MIARGTFGYEKGPLMASYDLHIIAHGVQQDIVAALSLADGTEYEFQNRGTNPIRFFDDRATAPAEIAGKEVAPLGLFSFTVDTAKKFWVWGVGGPAVLAYDD